MISHLPNYNTMMIQLIYTIVLFVLSSISGSSGLITGPQFYRESGLYVNPVKPAFSHLGYVGMPIMLPFLDQLPPIRQFNTCKTVLDGMTIAQDTFDPLWGYTKLQKLYTNSLDELRLAIPELNTRTLLLRAIRPNNVTKHQLSFNSVLRHPKSVLSL